MRALVDTHSSPARTDTHVVHFYDRDSALRRIVGRYLAEGLASGSVVIVIATEAHRRAFDAELKAAGLDPGEARADGVLVVLDAVSTLAQIRRGGRVDPELFRSVVGGVVQRAIATGRPVHAYGEMVDVLWKAGEVLGAIELEERWEQLRADHPLSLLCAYCASAVSDPEHADALTRICELHHDSNRVSCRFEAVCEAPRTARQFVDEALRRWGYRGSVLDDARLVLSELTTNAIVHARSPFLVIAHADGPRVRLAVQDASSAGPELREPSPTAHSGRGLRVVDAVASDWGVERTLKGKTVWVELSA